MALVAMVAWAAAEAVVVQVLAETADSWAVAAGQMQTRWAALAECMAVGAVVVDLRGPGALVEMAAVVVVLVEQLALVARVTLSLCGDWK
ncbi:MAG: hypothetical protein K2P94_18035 [Rhodospirillaceae bacterium]|nr:hypothetical protein [Rhodospirillaceae bacterium]